MPKTRRVVEAPGARLAAEIEGDGPPIVLVHSGLVDRRAWDALTPLLVAAGYRVLRYDMRGFGESPAEDVEFSPRDDLRAVLGAFEIDRAAVVGNSMGGAHALDAVIETPDRFAAMVWVGGGISGFEGEEVPKETEAFTALAAAHRAGDLDGETEWDVRIWVDGIGQPTTRVPPKLRREVWTADRALIEPGRIFGLEMPLEPPAIERLGEVQVPTLVVVGALDTPETRSAAERLSESVAAARYVVVPDVAHLIGMEVPGQLARLISEFVAPLPRWS